MTSTFERTYRPPVSGGRSEDRFAERMASLRVDPPTKSSPPAPKRRRKEPSA